MSADSLSKQQKELIAQIKAEHVRTLSYHDEEIAAHKDAIKRHMESIERHRVQQENCAGTVKRCEEVAEKSSSLSQYLNL